MGFKIILGHSGFQCCTTLMKLQGCFEKFEIKIKLFNILTLWSRWVEFMLSQPVRSQDGLQTDPSRAGAKQQAGDESTCWWTSAPAHHCPCKRDLLCLQSCKVPSAEIFSKRDLSSQPRQSLRRADMKESRWTACSILVLQWAGWTCVHPKPSTGNPVSCSTCMDL